MDSYCFYHDGVEFDTADRHVRTDRYRSAANVLESVDRTVECHVESGYDTGSLTVRSKDTIREMIAFRVQLLRDIAALSGGGNGNGSANGKGR